VSADDSDYIEKLLKLQKLKDMGVLNDQEYTERKNWLIDQYIGDKKEVKKSEQPENWVKVIDYNRLNNGSGNETWRMPIVFTPQVKWLCSIFANSMPKSYDDKLPATGKMFWYTEKYLSERPKDPNRNGTIVPFDDQVAIQERALTHIGLNLYDGGVWAVALSLSGLADLVDVYYRNVLYTSTTGSNEFADGLANIRASSHARDYYYGPSAITDKNLDKVKIPGNMTFIHLKDPKCCGTCCETTFDKEIPGGFFYRMVGPTYRMWDPFQGLYGYNWRAIPAGPNNDSTTPWNLAGLIHWNDWKPITGENVWAVILAPIQTMFIRNCSHVRKFKTFEEAPDELQFAVTIVPALKALKSPLGSMYHCPLGTDMFPVDPDEKTNVSNENNFSAYAAYRAFAFILDNFYAGGDSTLDKIKEDMKDLIDGLEKWFASHLMPQFMKGENAISQGGHVSFAGEYVYQDGEQAFAVDCQTWGLLNVGQKKFDAKYGFGMAYKIWQTTKKLSGYPGNVTRLSGVGYTVHNQKNQTKIWSGEWTWGAVFMCKRIGSEYLKAGQTAWGQEMLNDAKTMIEDMSKKCEVDNDGVWKSGGLVQVDGSHLYANNRFFIPWGWYANPIGATSSTSWAVFNDYEYNPFHLGGGFNSTFFERQCKDNQPDKDIMSKLAKFYDYDEKKPHYE
jgi:hypothetical protein